MSDVRFVQLMLFATHYQLVSIHAVLSSNAMDHQNHLLTSAAVSCSILPRQCYVPHGKWDLHGKRDAHMHAI